MTRPVRYVVHLTMTGKDTGSTNADLTFSSKGIAGHATSTYDGHTITGPPAYASGPEEQGGPKSACPRALPKQPALHVTAKRLPNDTYRVTVTASIAGVGAAEASTDTEPVYHAMLRLARTTTYTDTKGVAIVHVNRGGRLAVTAGDTLLPTSTRLARRPSPHG
jgi:hypothetical protein